MHIGIIDSIKQKVRKAHMNDKKGVICDMDGTVWDSSANVAKAWTVKVHEAGYTDKVVTREDIQSVMGKPMDVIADTLFTYTEKGPERDTLRSSCENYENAYLREHGGTLYDGVLETWAKLKELGYHIYIVEDIECYGNNLLQKDENIKLLAERNGLTDACYVGDIQSDYDATTKAGLPFIHAKYGFGEINAEVPFIMSFDELIKVVPEVIG